MELGTGVDLLSVSQIKGVSIKQFEVCVNHAKIVVVFNLILHGLLVLVLSRGGRGEGRKWDAVLISRRPS